MSDEDLAFRVDRLKTCLAVLLSVCSVLCVVAIYTSWVTDGMYDDFGAKLPAVSRFVLELRMLWILLAVGLPAASVWIGRNRKPEFHAVFSTAASIALLAIALLIVYGTFLPIFKMSGSYSGG